MRLAALLALVALVACSGPPLTGEPSSLPPVELPFIIGQSNAAFLRLNPAGLLNTLRASGRIVPQVYGVQHSGTEISLWQEGTSFGDEMRAAFAAAQADLVKFWTHHAQRVSVIWIQGESDAIGSQALADAYEGALRTFLAGISADWSDPHIYVVRLHPNMVLAHKATVQAAQDTVCAEAANYHEVIPDAIVECGNLHYDIPAGTDALGVTVANTIITVQDA